MNHAITMVLLIGEPYSQVLDSNFPLDNHHQHVHNPSITLNYQETRPIQQLRPEVNKTSLLASVMVQQPMIQAVISSVEMFDGNRSKFVSWIASMEMQHKFQGKMSCA